MAHIVGVPRRDPCQKCQLPVFLAERVLIGKAVYHRTCLKCARCGAQLTLGSFYETETNNEYCCETCPDEEEPIPTVAMQSEEPGAGSVRARASSTEDDASLLRRETVTTTATPTRRSIADRLAFFEQNNQSTMPDSSLKSSPVSDEEKQQQIINSKRNLERSSFLRAAIGNQLEPIKLNNDKDEVKSSADIGYTNLLLIEEPDIMIANDDDDNDNDDENNDDKVVKTEIVADTEAEAEGEVENEPKPPALPKSAAPELATITEPAANIKTIDNLDNDDDSEAIETLIESSCTEPLPVPVPEPDTSTLTRLSKVSAQLQHLEEHKVMESTAVGATSSALENTSTSEFKVANDNADANERMLSEKLKIIEPNDDEPNDTARLVEPSAAVQTLNASDSEKLVVPMAEITESATTTTAGVAPISLPRLVVHKSTAETAEQKLSDTAAKAAADIDYPEDLNPFASDDDDEDDGLPPIMTSTPKKSTNNTAATSCSLNPFDSSDDEVELEKPANRSSSLAGAVAKVPPPRPPPPLILRSTETSTSSSNQSWRSSLSLSPSKRLPLPTPRKSLSQSQSTTPEPTPRMRVRHAQSTQNSQLELTYDSNSSLNASAASSPSGRLPLQRNSELRASITSLASTASGTGRYRKARRAPVPPTPTTTAKPTVVLKELFSELNNSSNVSGSDSAELKRTPLTSRKKRPAPAPPKPARLEMAATATTTQALVGSQISLNIAEEEGSNATAVPKNVNSYPLRGTTESNAKQFDEDKAPLEGKPNGPTATVSRLGSMRRIIPLSAYLLSDNDDEGGGNSDDTKLQRLEQEEANVVYRRVLMPPELLTPPLELMPGKIIAEFEEQAEGWQHEKCNKEAENRNRRQSQISANDNGNESDSSSSLAHNGHNKSLHGKWKRRKGPAPALPIPARKVLEMLPLQTIRQELEIIEMQQQGLERQGVVIEQMIRDRCEGGGATGAVAADGGNGGSTGELLGALPDITQNSKEVEDLILQLFELVNEKNELFRRQAELMYLRRQNRLEQEQADIEYEIRVLMGQPERNKTDSDKAREEALIARLVKVVELRNEVINSLEMDRVRETEEDLSIKQRLQKHNAERLAGVDSQKHANATAAGTQTTCSGSTKLSKKERKQQKDAAKKLFFGKSKKLDVDKDDDESEHKTAAINVLNVNVKANTTGKEKKKKRKLFF